MHTVVNMAELAPPRAKKAKRSAPISCVSAEERAKQFKDDVYADGGVLFCKYCVHSVDYTRIDTIKDHLKSKKHCAKERLPTVERNSEWGSSRTLYKHAMHSFLQIYCKQAGTLPQVSTLCNVYVPRLYEKHYLALTEVVKNKTVSIVADETTDVRDHSILNVIASICGKPYLIGVIKMEACNHKTFSQTIINPRRACAARVPVVVLCVCMCVCVYVCMCVCVCVHSYLPPHTLESQKRDTNGFCAIQGSF